MTTPRETLTKGFPLLKEVQRQPVQSGFKMLQLFVYFGKEDLERHLQHVVVVAVLYGCNEVTKYQPFPLSLVGQA